MIESRLSMIIEVLRNYCAWDVLIMNCMMLDYVKNKDKLEINKNKCNPWLFILSRKPFNCELCLTFWISLIYLLILHTQPFYAIILSGATAYLTAPLKRML